MQQVNDCFIKVKKDCFKFISSQETKRDKFKNKEKMIKSFLIPISFWISKRTNKKKPLIIGLAGGQGSGKTTISSILTLILQKYFKLKVFKISIDDFYKTRKDRKLLSKNKHSLLMTRGVPGTHDVDLMLKFFKKVKSKRFKNLTVPKFNKSIDDRYKKSLWYKLKFKPDVVIFEGWCVGAKSQTAKQLKKPVNSFEKVYDKKLKWRSHVNNQLKTKYKTLFNQLDELLYLKAKNFNLLRNWRLKQERKLRIQTKNKKDLKIMSIGDVINFMQTYQRITQQMFKDAIKNSSIIMNLNSRHQIQNMKFKK
ncbi:D-glycerate 3-kinase [Candidatus Pelagibacter ubique]|uniref:D-glycerate 3-kinase n=1 Tax=Pelagibacter ubique TaxID=198252 RepID=A0ABX1T1Q3_PELUQ|nr:uridine kinase [Candidatus Pelagibacter ubique]NMN66978.1 D-glycerate 3-kinase [Candidatus Pelagibacter ubique]